MKGWKLEGEEKTAEFDSSQLEIGEVGIIVRDENPISPNRPGHIMIGGECELVVLTTKQVYKKKSTWAMHVIVRRPSQSESIVFGEI